MTEQKSARPQDPAAQGQDLAAKVYDTAGGDAYVMEIPLRDAGPDQIGVEATVDTVTVSMGAQSRVFEFPMDLDTDRIRAQLQPGMLRIEAPKAVIGKRRVIRIEQSAPTR